MLRLVGIALLSLQFLLARGVAAGTNTVPLEPSPDYAGIASRIARSLPATHLTRVLVDDAISRRAWTNYLASLDFERVYFLESDIAQFRRYEAQLDEDLSDGRLGFAYEVFEVFKQRVADRCRYVGTLLEKGLDLTENETFLLRRRDVPWPKDEAEWNEIWRKKIKNEYLRQMLAIEFAQTRAASGTTNATTNAVATLPPADLPESEEAVADLVTGTVKAPSIEEIILKRYMQMQTVLQDSDSESVLQRYLSAFAQAYDPYSVYLTPDAGEDFDIDMKLSLVGIGALLRAEDGAAKIVELIPGGPADRDHSKNRLEPGDKIIAVGQGDEEPVDILHRPLNKIVRLIRGEKGTKVVLTVIPVSDPTESTTRTVEIIRDEVKLEKQAASWSLHTAPGEAGSAERRLGVIRLPTFYANMQAQSAADPNFRSCSHDVAKAIEELQKQGAEGLLLDLRNNGGGALLEAVRMVGLFIRTGPTVMVKERRVVRVLPDTDPAVAYHGPLVVLVNRLSASASEIVTGALQDYARAVIVGDSKTYGKGTVQTILQLGLDPKLGKIKVTTASYYRISGGSTQLRGISPDIVIPSAYDFMEIGEDFQSYPVEWSTVQPADFTPVADLSVALQTLKSRSEERLKTDKRYEVYRKLLERIKKLSENREVPLRIDERRKMAAEEKELSDRQAELAPVPDEESGGENGKKDHDVVLDEALRILSDLCGFDAASLRPQPSDTATPDKKSWPELIEDMLRNL